MTWGREEEPAVAVERILDAAGTVFARKGVLDTRVGDVAVEAGCSRGTVYRYFTDRDGLRRAYVDREAVRVGGRVAARVDASAPPDRRLVDALLAALDEVRSEPVLMAWFVPEVATTTGEMAARAGVITELVGAFLDDLRTRSDGSLRAAVDRDLATDWVVRVVLSLLAHPAADEQRVLESFLVPALFTG